MSSEIYRAIEDFRYLLNRGYNRSSALRFVSDKYGLDIKGRNILERSVFSEKDARKRRSKLVDIEEIYNQRLLIDGYNVLITVENILYGGEIVECDDGFIRDVSATFGKYKIKKETFDALDKILSVLKKFNPGEVIFCFDSQVSYSGKLSQIVRNELKRRNIRGNAKTFKNVDYVLINESGIVCTSDRVIIDKVKKVLDIPRYIYKMRS